MKQKAILKKRSKIEEPEKIEKEIQKIGEEAYSVELQLSYKDGVIKRVDIYVYGINPELIDDETWIKIAQLAPEEIKTKYLYERCRPDYYDHEHNVLAVDIEWKEYGKGKLNKELKKLLKEYLK